jgi:hypothetical protein
MIVSLWWGTEDCDPVTRRNLLVAELVWMFGFTKVIKLVGLFMRDPRDIIFLPVSVVFGWLHGLIKLHALLTLNMVRHPFKHLRVKQFLMY